MHGTVWTAVCPAIVSALLILFGVLITTSNNLMLYAFHSYQPGLFPTHMRARAVASCTRLVVCQRSLLVL